MTEQAHTPGPWDYIASTEHHGPYVTSDFGSTICDCYVMSKPGRFGVDMGETGKPVSFMHEMADPNARLIAAAPDMLAALQECVWLLADLQRKPGLVQEKANRAIAKAIGKPIGKRVPFPSPDGGTL